MFFPFRKIIHTLWIGVLILAACNAPATTTLHDQQANTLRPAPSAAATKPASTPSKSKLPAFSHVFIIVLENKEESAVINNTDAAYFNKLATQYARATNYYGIRHPSLPNYLAMIGGDTFGVKSDCTKCFINEDNLAAQLETAGHSWKGYMEGMPQPCYVGSADPYAQKHNPFIYFDNIRNDPTRCNKLVPLTQLDADLQANPLPHLVWITPDLCSDTHDCPISTGDKWLETWVPKLLASPAWKNNGVLFITYDEGSGNKGCCQLATGGEIATLVISPLVKAGFQSSVPYNHYSLLRTIEEAWGLPLLRNAGCDCTQALSDFFAK